MARELQSVVPQPRTGNEVIYATHNFCDRTTWYGESVRAENEAASEVSGTEWDLANSNVICIEKILDFTGVLQDSGTPEHLYAVVVEVDSVEMTQRDPFRTTFNGEDYYVDYDNGKIIFASSQTGKDVRVWYSYATGSTFYMKPEPGKLLHIEKAKAQWSANYSMDDELVFQVVGNGEVFAPQLWNGFSPPGPYPAGTQIPLVTTRYLTEAQLLLEAEEWLPELPITGTGPRARTEKWYGVKFAYRTKRTLSSAAGMMLTVKLAHDLAFAGEHASATFGCVSEDE